MNDRDIETEFEDLAGRFSLAKAPPYLRERVLNQVERELKRKPWLRWQGIGATAAATLIALAIGGNLVVIRMHDQNLTRILGPARTNRSLHEWAETVAPVTGNEMAAKLEAHYSEILNRPDPAPTWPSVEIMRRIEPRIDLK